MKERRSTIQQEIKQTRPFKSTAQEAVLSLVRTVGAMMYEFERVAATEGITFQQYNVLRILRGAGEALPTMEIGERLLQRTPGISRTLERLEKQGLIRRTRGVNDGRQVLCALTPAGRRIVDRLDAPVDSLDNNSMAVLDVAEQKLLIQVLQKVRDNLNEKKPK